MRGVVKKRVDGSTAAYYYVYRQGRVNRKVVTKYIGKLEDIANFYLTYSPLILSLIHI